MFKKLCAVAAGILLAVAVNAAEPQSSKTENLPKNTQKEPLFKDGKGYYSYKQPLENLAQSEDGRVLIQYFYKYDCQVCLNADDYLKQYAELNQDKVVLVRTPSFDKNSALTSKMNATFIEYGKPELSDLYLFDSVGLKDEASLVKNNQAISRWLINHDVEPKRFLEVMNSEAVKKRVEQDVAVFKRYNPPFTPMAVLNGKYILLQNTLYNDDYTYAVLDFLVEKIQQELQEEKNEK